MYHVAVISIAVILSAFCEEKIKGVYPNYSYSGTQESLTFQKNAATCMTYEIIKNTYFLLRFQISIPIKYIINNSLYLKLINSFFLHIVIGKIFFLIWSTVMKL